MKKTDVLNFHGIALVGFNSRISQADRIFNCPKSGYNCLECLSPFRLSFDGSWISSFTLRDAK